MTPLTSHVASLGSQGLVFLALFTLALPAEVPDFWFKEAGSKGQRGRAPPSGSPGDRGFLKEPVRAALTPRHAGLDPYCLTPSGQRPPSRARVSPSWCLQPQHLTWAASSTTVTWIPFHYSLVPELAWLRTAAGPGVFSKGSGALEAPTPCSPPPGLD